MTERIEYFPGDVVRIGEKEFVLPESSGGVVYQIETENDVLMFNRWGHLSGYWDLGSLFILVKRAPRKVTRTIWVNLYHASLAGKNQPYLSCVYDSQESADKIGQNRLFGKAWPLEIEVDE